MCSETIYRAMNSPVRQNIYARDHAFNWAGGHEWGEGGENAWSDCPGRGSPVSRRQAVALK